MARHADRRLGTARRVQSERSFRGHGGSGRLVKAAIHHQHGRQLLPECAASRTALQRQLVSMQRAYAWAVHEWLRLPFCSTSASGMDSPQLMVLETECNSHACSHAGGLVSADDERFRTTFTDIYHQPDLQVISVACPTACSELPGDIPPAPSSTAFASCNRMSARDSPDTSWLCHAVAAAALPCHRQACDPSRFTLV